VHRVALTDPVATRGAVPPKGTGHSNNVAQKYASGEGRVPALGSRLTPAPEELLERVAGEAGDGGAALGGNLLGSGGQRRSDAEGHLRRGNYMASERRAPSFARERHPAGECGVVLLEVGCERRSASDSVTTWPKRVVNRVS
jgi:hypothetical protein